jgi:8-amino-3,8-dideoxy-alpha-D-manno-octulosonate transaminase
VGTIGNAGTFSFDFVKTITCAEGGVVMTNNESVFTKCDGFTDHGHDHKGIDRGADLHPFIGYNFRISELHAAVGLAQIRKLDTFLGIQKRNHSKLKAILSTVPEIGFRRIPEGGEDSCTFLSWFLPSEEITKKFVEAMKEQGTMAGNFYWYDNNWHYIKKWNHLKSAASLYSLSSEQQDALTKLNTQDFAASDAVMSCCISTAISLLWTDDQLEAKANKIVEVVKSVL